MKAASVRAVLSALRDAGVRYLVADGLAVNAYGFLRFTKDADLVIELIPENINAAFNALASLGYKPGVPITAEQFANPQNRESWIREKDMKVLQFWSAEHRQTPLDIFIHIPFDFETEFTAASTKELREIGPIPIVTLPTLFRMKKAANREQDRIDLDNLRLLYPTEALSNGGTT